jgi:glucosamine-6-phosphate deaminase
MGQGVEAAAASVAAEIRRCIVARGRAIGIFSGAPMLAAFYDALAGANEIEWTRVIAFQTGEYLGLDERAEGSHRRLLIERVMMRVPLVEFHALRGEAANPRAVAKNYAAQLRARPLDFAVLDLGARGELAFNEPDACDLDDARMVRVVALADRRRALALTIPALLAPARIFALALDAPPAECFEGPITPACPASALRRHSAVELFTSLAGEHR